MSFFKTYFLHFICNIFAFCAQHYIGGMTNELVSVTTPLAIGSGEAATKIQDILNGILPGMLPLAVTGIYYSLMKKEINVLWLIIGTAVVGIACAQFGILG